MNTRGVIFLRRDVARNQRDRLLAQARIFMRAKGFGFCTEIIGDDAASVETLIHTVAGPRPTVVAVGSLAHLVGGAPAVSRLAELRWWADVYDVATGALWSSLPQGSRQQVETDARAAVEQVARTADHIRCARRAWGDGTDESVFRLSQPERAVVVCLVVGQPRRTKDIARQVGVSDDQARYLLDRLQRQDYTVSVGQAGWLPTQRAAALIARLRDADRVAALRAEADR